ncbi:MAG: helix-turn-helix domain-containing protein [Ruminococcaceae bacterium]|nr:helix-turn-helix domain-containing protein [Oscillospiraceae bacterium]
MRQLPTYNMNDYPASIVAAGIKQAVTTCCHWHDCCEMELVLDGTGVHYINGAPHPMRPGDLYLFTPADNHEIHADECVTVIGIMFEEKLVTSELFSRILALEAMGETLLVNLNGEVHNMVKCCFEAVLREEIMLREEKNPGDSALYISRLLDCILVELLRALVPSDTLPTVAPVRDAILHLYRHYTEPLSLSGVAEHLHLNSSYFSQLFRKTTGQTFKGYLIDLRLRNACRLLAGTSLSVTEICFSCGFESYSHFMRTFKERYHVSPLVFRRNNLTPAERPR